MFSKAHAQRAIDFVERRCRWTKGPAAKSNIVLEPWMREIFSDIFGTLRDDGSGLRQYNDAFVYVPRKNGKSMGIATPIGLYCLFAEKPAEYGAEIYSCAKDREQASIIFNMAKSMVMMDDGLRSRAHIVPSRRLIAFPRTESFWRALPKDGMAAQGYDPYVVLFDELHTQADEEMVGAMREGMGARRQPLMIKVSTAGKDPGQVCKREVDFALNVQRGVIEAPHYYSKLYYKKDNQDWLDEQVWRDCNPSSFRNFEEMRKYAARAQSDKRIELRFRLYYLNEPIEEAAGWLTLDEWDATAGIVDEYALRGRRCWGSFDLSSTQDLTSWVLVFPDDDTGEYHVLCRNFLPEEGIDKKSERDGQMYRQWAEEGLLTLTSGNMIDLDFIREQIFRDAEEFKIQEIAYDPFRSNELVPKLMEQGLTVFPHRQGFLSMGPATNETERLILSRKLRHGGNKVMRWAFSNTRMEEDAAGNFKPSKRNSKSRIDPIVALIMSAGRAALVERKNKPTVYATRGFQTL